MRLRRNTLLLIGLALILILGVGTFSLMSLGGHGSTKAGVKLTAASSLKRPSEMIGGCGEADLDHGHDVDPPGFKDQEDDECLPAQHELRNKDGTPLSSQPDAS